MFKKRKAKKAEIVRQLQADVKIRSLKREAYEKEKADEKAEFDKYFEDKDLSDLFDEVMDKMELIEKAVIEDDHTLTNDYTGKARNIITDFGFIKPLCKLTGHLKITAYRVLTGAYTGYYGSMIKTNFKEVYLKFKIYEEKFPESLILLFKLKL